MAKGEKEKYGVYEGLRRQFACDILCAMFSSGTTYSEANLTRYEIAIQHAEKLLVALRKKEAPQPAGDYRINPDVK